MLEFTAIIKRFEKQGEKTGWTYIDVPAKLAQQLKPVTKKSFRVKGMLDAHSINRVALIPMGDGDYIIALNAAMRKSIGKSNGATILVKLDVDESKIEPPADFISCLNDEPDALLYFNSLAPSHQLYFIKWIESSKTEPTRTKRLAQSISALSKRKPFDEMLRALKKERMEGF